LRAVSTSARSLDSEQAIGRVLAQDVSVQREARRITLLKGRILAADDVPLLQSLGPEELHLIELEASDVHEDAAALEIAEAVAGPGIAHRDPAESQVKLVAARRGLLEINTDTLTTINMLPIVAVFSLYDGQAVDVGDKVAGVKVGPLVVSRETLDTVKSICAREGPPLTVRPFQPLRVTVLDRDRLQGEQRRRHQAQLIKRIAWLGGELKSVALKKPNDPAAIAAVLREQLAAGPDLIIIAGTNSTDPLDAAVQALQACGGELIRIGMPAHPGSTYWLARAGETPILGIGSCGMLSGATVFDILLPRYFAGLPVDSRFLASLGHGGMLTKGMKFRFPAYAD
jgi:hypothetical protein